MLMPMAMSAAQRHEIHSEGHTFMKRYTIGCWWAVFCIVALTSNAPSQGLFTPPSTVTGLTHQYGHYAPFGVATEIRDYAAGNQFIQTGFTATITGSELVVASFEAPASQMFVIHEAPAGFVDVLLQLNLSWAASGTSLGSASSPTSLSIVFENLTGAEPILLSSVNSLGILGNRISFSNSFSVAPGTTFTGVQLFAQFATSVSSPSEQTLTPSTFTFQAVAWSSEILGDGTLMTLEPIPEPSAVVLVLLGSGVLLFATKRLPL